MRRSSLTVLILLLCSCSTTKPPDWVAGKSSAYPDAKYLVGVGSAATRTAAENEARAGIGRIFRVDIKSSFEVLRVETLTTQSGVAEGNIRERTTSKVDAGLVKTLEGTEIAEVWEDPEKGKFHALAVLERVKARVILQDRIVELDGEIQTTKEKTGEAASNIEKLRLMKRGIELLQQREALNDDFRIVNPQGVGVSAGYSIEREKSELDRFLKSGFHIRVRGKGAGVEKLVDLFIEGLTEKGFVAERTLDTPGSASDLDVVLEYEEEPSSEPVDDWYYCRWQLGMEAIDHSAGLVVVSELKQGKAGQLSVEKSQARASFEAGRAVPALVKKVTDFLAGTE